MLFQKYNFMNYRLRSIVTDSGEYWFSEADAAKGLWLIGSALEDALDRIPTKNIRKVNSFKDKNGNYPMVSVPEQLHDSTCRVVKLSAVFKSTGYLVNEAGLYQLATFSRNPNAKRFQSWIYEDILPSLRKEGHYEVPGYKADAPVVCKPSANMFEERESKSEDEEDFRLTEELQMNLTVRSRSAKIRIEGTFYEGAQDPMIMRVREHMQCIFDAIQDNIEKPKAIQAHS